MADLSNSGDIDVDIVALKNDPVTTQVALTTANTAYQLPSSPASGRKVLVIYNDSDTDIYIGGSGVTTSDGMPIPTGKYIYFTIDAGENTNVYAVCGTSSKTVRVMEI